MSLTITQTIDGTQVQPNGVLRLSALLSLFQKAAELDLQDLGISVTAMIDGGLSFVVTKMTLHFLGDIRVGDTVSVETRPRPVHGFSFPRDYIVRRDGEKLVECSSVWALIDIHSRKLAPPSALEPFGVIPPDTDEPISLPRIIAARQLTQPERTDERRVYPSMLDRNRHVNNARYGDFVYDYLPDSENTTYCGRYFLMEYHTEMKLDDICSVSAGTQDGKWQTIGLNAQTNQIIFRSVLDFS